MIGNYILVDEDDAPLYVGASCDVARRVRDHRRSPWWGQVADVQVIPAADREAAYQQERHLIHTLRPRFNKYHRGFVACPCGCKEAASW